MRFALLGLLIACGGAPKPAAAPIANAAPEPVSTNVPAPPPVDDQSRAPAMTGDPCEGGQVVAPPAAPTGKPPAPVPSVAVGQPTVGPELDKAIIRRYIRRNINKIQYCYEKALLATPGIAGKINSTFVIGADGKVASSTATGFDADVAECIAAVIKDIEFPKPKGGGNVNVSYPFVFTSAGG